MKHRIERGGAAIEFSMILLFLTPLLLGAGVIGVNLIRVQQTTQLAREAGYMFARGMSLWQPGNQTTLATIGSPLGLSTTAGSGSALIILSALTYVDKQTCAEGGAVDAQGNPSGCTNYGQWVFAQRLTIGNSSVRTSNLGSPLAGGPTGVTIDSTTGQIPASDYVTKAGAVAQFNAVNPYANVNGAVSGLPSKQFLYVAEAAATVFSMPPFVSSSSATYSYGLF